MQIYSMSGVSSKFDMKKACIISAAYNEADNISVMLNIRSNI